MIGPLLSNVKFDKNTATINRIIRITIYSSCIFIILALFIPLLYWSRLPPLVPLWFSRPWGLERLTSVFGLFFPPLSCVFWLLTTIHISIRLLKEHLVFSQILSVVTLIISIMSFITVATIITLVI